MRLGNQLKQDCAPTTFCFAPKPTETETTSPCSFASKQFFGPYRGFCWDGNRRGRQAEPRSTGK